MDQAPRVSCVERAGNLGEQPARAVRLQPIAEKSLQIPAGDVTHCDVELAIGLTGGVDRDDVGMIE
jgi:hypothetical protein